MNRTSAQLTNIQALSPADWAALAASSSDFNRASALGTTWALRATKVSRKRQVLLNTGRVLLLGNGKPDGGSSYRTAPAGAACRERFDRSKRVFLWPK